MDPSPAIENKVNKITDDRRAIHMSIGIALIFFGTCRILKLWNRIQYISKLCGADLW